MIRNIQVLPESHRLEVTFVGSVTLQDRLETLALVAPLVHSQKLDRILLNFSAAWHEPPLDKGGVPFEHTLRDAGGYVGRRVAFVSRPHTYSAPKGDDAPELGFEFRCFTGRHAALAWLEQA